MQAILDFEVWGNVKSYEGFYEVSTFGNVRRFGSNHNLKPDIQRSGHLQVTLYTNNSPVRFKVHRIECMCFKPNPENKPHINHIDNDPANNHIDNIEWCTPSENTCHAVKTGRLKGRKNEKHHQCKLSNSQITEIRELRRAGQTLLSISFLYGISFQHVSRIVNHKQRIIEDFEFNKRTVPI